MPVRAKRDRLAVDQSAFGRQTADRLRDLRQLVGEIRAVAAPKDYSASFLACDDPVPVVLDLMQPAHGGGRLVDEEGLAREDETSRRGPPGTLGRDTPQHVAVYKGRTMRAREQ